jgi:hypothetical protein
MYRGHHERAAKHTHTYTHAHTNTDTHRWTVV